MGVDSLYPQEDMSPSETMDDYTSDFRLIFKEVSEEQIRKDPRTIISYMRDTKIDPAIIRVVDTMIMYSRIDFIASITSPDDSVLKSVDRIASNTFVDKSVLTQLINMMRDARGLGTTVVKTDEFVSPITSTHQKIIQKVTSETPSKSTRPVVKMIACWDPESRQNVMKAVDGSAYYSKDLKELVRCDRNTLTLVMPDSVEKIGFDAFKGCTKLREIYFPRSMTAIKCDLWPCRSLETVHIPDTVTQLKSWCFSNCTSLVNIELPPSLKVIEGNVFYKCQSLTKIIIPKDVLIVKESAFNSCNSIEKVEVLGSDTVLEDGAFDSCCNLEEIYLYHDSLEVTDKCLVNCPKCIINRWPLF